MTGLIKNSNKIYKIEYSVGGVVFVNRLFIEPKYRKRGYPKRIFNGLCKKYQRPIHLLCFPTLFDFYTRIGFVFDCEHCDGYLEMKYEKELL